MAYTQDYLETLVNGLNAQLSHTVQIAGQGLTQEQQERGRVAIGAQKNFQDIVKDAPIVNGVEIEANDTITFQHSLTLHPGDLYLLEREYSGSANSAARSAAVAKVADDHTVYWGTGNITLTETSLSATTTARNVVISKVTLIDTWDQMVNSRGYRCVNSGSNACAEGEGTEASGDNSHAEGYRSTASGYAAHSEGNNTTASGDYAHAEGVKTIASHTYSHAEGYCAQATGQTSHAEGHNTVASGHYSHAEGTFAKSTGKFAHAEGHTTIAGGETSHAEGSSTKTSGNAAHSEGRLTTASGAYSHAEGCETTASKYAAHSEGGYTTASGNYSHAEGCRTTSSNAQTHAEGYGTTASRQAAHAEGYYTQATATYAHAEGQESSASKDAAHAEGYGTVASGYYAHAEGCQTTASGYAAHAEGRGSSASKNYSHAEGYSTKASGDTSHAEGNFTTASGTDQHVQGKYNEIISDMAHIVGGGSSTSNRFNIHTIDWDGNAEFRGDVIARGCGLDGEPVSLLEMYDNRTHYTEPAYSEITWNGDIDGLVEAQVTNPQTGEDIDMGQRMFKVSDLLLTMDDCRNSIVTLASNDETMSFDIDEAIAVDEDLIGLSEAGPFICLKDNHSVALTDTIEMRFPEAGVYFVFAEEQSETMYVSSFKYISGEIVHQIDEKFIPEAIARVSDVSEVASKIVQSDYEVSDPDNIAYIKNKPFYVEAAHVVSEYRGGYYNAVGGGVNVGGSLYTYNLGTLPIDMNIGDVYYLCFKDYTTGEDLIEYPLTVQPLGDSTGVYCVGNPAIFPDHLNGGEAPDGLIDTGEHAIIWYSSSGTPNLTIRSAGDLSFVDGNIYVVLKQKDVVHTLDSKFIPDAIARVADVANVYETQAHASSTYETKADALAKVDELKSYTDIKVAGIVDSAPETLNTLNELSAALGNDENFATTVATQIGLKVDKVEGKGLSTNDYTTAEKTSLATIASQVLPTSLIIADAITGESYTLQIQNGQLVSFPTEG